MKIERAKRRRQRRRMRTRGRKGEEKEEKRKEKMGDGTFHLSSKKKTRKNISPAPNIHKELKTFNSGVKQDILFMSYIKFCITR